MVRGATKAKARLRLSSAVEHACDRLEADFVVQDEQRFVLLLSTGFLPVDCRDALGIPEAQPLQIKWIFASTWVTAEELPSVTLTYCSHSSKRTPEEYMRSPTQATPHDKFLHQMKQILDSHLNNIWPPTDAKAVQSLFTSTYSYLQQRLATLSSYCVVCDAELASPGPKPVPCGNPVCNFAFDELGLGSGVSELYQSPEVADLLISMAASTIICPNETRRQLLFATVPSAFVTKPSTYGQPPQLNWQKLRQVIESLPRVQAMAASTQLHTLLQECPEGYNLIRWILSTNRSYIVRLQEDELLQEMNTPHQFRLTLSSASHSARFAATKAKKGSFYAFHGSSFFNWHSILRTSLKNCSGGTLQSTGAAYGSGVYLGLDSTMSFSYMGTGNGWSNSQYGTSPRCLALCEVINGAQIHSNPIVVPDESQVITRYLFVYDTATTLPRSSVLAANLAARCEAAARHISWDIIPMHTQVHHPIAPSFDSASGTTITPASCSSSQSFTCSTSHTAARAPPTAPAQLPQRAPVAARLADTRAKLRQLLGRWEATDEPSATTEGRQDPSSTDQLSGPTATGRSCKVTALDDDDDVIMADGDGVDDEEDEGEADDDSSKYEYDDQCEDDDDDGAYGGMDFAEDGGSPSEPNRAVGGSEEDRQLGPAVGAARTLMKELRSLSKMDTLKEGFEAYPVDDANMLEWEAKLYLNEGTLAGELQQYSRHHKQNYMKLRMHFPADYPINPPFVWLVSPRLQYRTGFVSRGAICTTMLVNTGTSAGWSATYTIDKVLMVIRSNFQDPEAKGMIENMRVHREYSEQEAREGYLRAKSLHGW